MSRNLMLIFLSIILGMMTPAASYAGSCKTYINQIRKKLNQNDQNKSLDWLSLAALNKTLGHGKKSTTSDNLTQYEWRCREDSATSLTVTIGADGKIATLAGNYSDEAGAEHFSNLVTPEVSRATIDKSIIKYKFSADQAYDVQRSPGFPIAGNAFNISGLQQPYDSQGSSYQLSNGEYLQVFFVGGNCQNGNVGLNLYSADGALVKTIHPSGHIYGISNVGFLFDNDRNIGTFLFFNPNNKSTVSYTPTTGPAPETCESLNKL